MITIIYSTHKDETYNNKFRQHLLQTVGLKDIQILEYVNHNQFSLSELYNKGVSESENDIVVCCHNDIKLESGWGKKLLKDFNDNPDYGIIGKAGSCYFPESGVYWERMQQTMVGQVYHHPDGQNKWLSKYSAKLPFLIPVVTIDGLFISFDKTKINHQFDETIGKFHFYDHLFCIPNYIDGIKIGVTSSFEITHQSVGQPNQEFWESKDKFVEKWGKHLPLDLKPQQVYVPEIKEKPLKNIGKIAIILVCKNLITTIKTINSYVEQSNNDLYSFFIYSKPIKDELFGFDNITLITGELTKQSSIYNYVVNNYVDNTYDYLIFTDERLRPINNVIHNLLKTYKSIPKIGTLSGRIHDDENLTMFDGIFFNKEFQESYRNKESYYNYSTSLSEVDSSSTNFLMVSKSLFNNTGQFNEQSSNFIFQFNLNLKHKKYQNYLDGNSVLEFIKEREDVKIISGYSEKGGSTTAFINLTNFFNENGINCTFYGPHEWHLDKCKSDLISNLKFEKNDVVISHFLNLQSRPDVKKIVLSCHENWWYEVADVKQYWDEIIFLHDKHREYHKRYLGKFSIIPNLKENLISIEKPELDKVAGIIGTIEDRKQTHVSIQRALNDGCEKILLYGHIGDENYYKTYVTPLMSNSNIILMGHSTNKQNMYNSIGRVYHSSKGEVACLVKDECYLTNTKFYGNEETENEVSKLTNPEILTLWKNILNL